MGTSFVILFPLGAIIIKFLSNRVAVPVKLHYMTQLTTYTLLLAGMGLGIYLSKGIQFKYARKPPHPTQTNQIKFSE